MNTMDRLQQWTASLGLPGLTEPLDPLGQAIGIHLYRMLATGVPVQPLLVAEAIGVSEQAVHDALEGRPGVVCNDAGNVTAYFGLTLKPMPHHLVLDGKTLYTWCAWDTMLVAHILGREVDVHSPCPVTGSEVRLTLGGDGVVRASPSTARISMVTPTFETLATDFHAAFCGRIHFLAHQDAELAWLADNPDGLTLTLDDAFEFARTRNERVFGSALADAA